MGEEPGSCRGAEGLTGPQQVLGGPFSHTGQRRQIYMTVSAGLGKSTNAVSF